MEEWDENAQNTMYEILKELIRIPLQINPNKGQTTKLKNEAGNTQRVL